jgi:aryl-alcohol dehydrogenase-like predicted oxidoreductase
MKTKLTRRSFLQNTAAVSASLGLFPYIGTSAVPSKKLMKRTLGRIGFESTTMGLGGQASLQWTPADVVPEHIITKAISLGINYFDTSNYYGPSQTIYGKAFNKMDLIPGKAGYNEKLRRSIFLTSKTGIRMAKGEEGFPYKMGGTNGPKDSMAIDDVKRSLSQIFGDGKGNYPKGAYLDMVLIHNVMFKPIVDLVYVGYENTSPDMERIGTLAALRDLRDGTNLTGLNPKEEKLIRHVGFSGHKSPALLMEMMRRDTGDLLDAMLVSINANDHLMASMQHNAIPVAAEKNMGIIGMKVFADGAMYTKEAHWTKGPHEVVRTVGSKRLPSKELIQYTLTTSGVHNAIIGIGQISDNPQECQLIQNLDAAQIAPDGLSRSDRLAIEQLTAPIKKGKTNYFQNEDEGLKAPANTQARIVEKDGKKVIRISWDTSIASDQPLDHYLIMRNGQKIGTVPHQPQTTLEPFSFYFRDSRNIPSDTVSYQVMAVDKAGRQSGASFTGLG